MKQNNPTLNIAISALALGYSALAANAQTIVFTETFDPLPEALTDFNMQLGGNPESKPVNTKIFALGQWGLTQNGSIVSVGGDNGNALQPQLDDKNNGRVGGIFIDPALFAATGAGAYTLSFDVIPSSTPGAGRVYIGAGSGYDLSGTTDAKLNFNVSTNGFGVKKADGTLAWPALTGSGGATATHLITTTTQWVLGDGTETGEFREAPGAPFDVETAATVEVEFAYDGSSAIVIAFGGYNTDVKVDNIKITSAAPGGDTWAGYTIVDGYVDTGSFMGWLFIGDDPWIYSLSLDGFLYMPESFVSDLGAWTYIPR